MKQLTLTAILFCALCGICAAGTAEYSGKEMKQAVVPQGCDEFYGDRELDITMWGTYAYAGSDDNRARIEAADDFGIFGSYDRFLGDDHAWGGGLDAKYFLCRYFGVGMEGFAVSARANHAFFDEGPNPPVGEEFYADSGHVVGAALGTFTIRYPFHCSRFAPYAWAGGGGIFGGRNDRTFRAIDPATGTAFSASDYQKENRVMGQFGGGLEVRITRHIGITGDFSWNVVDGPKNNFGMVRSGLNFAF